MTDSYRFSFGITDLINYLEDDFRTRFLISVLKARKQLDHISARKLQNAIKQKLKINAFQDANRAEAGLLIKPLGEKILEDDELAASALWMWVNIKLDLAEKVRKFLTKNGYETNSRDVPLMKLTRHIDMAILEEQVNDFLSENQNISRDEAEIMMLWVSGCMPMSEDQLREILEEFKTDKIEEPELHPYWRILLDKLKSLEPKSEEWDTADIFVTQMEELILLKLEERSKSAGDLDNILKRVIEKSYSLHRGVAATMANWRTEQCPEDEIEKTLLNLETLEALIERYSDLKKQIDFSNLEEEELALQQQGELVARIREILKDAGSIFEKELKDQEKAEQSELKTDIDSPTARRHLEEVDPHCTPIGKFDDEPDFEFECQDEEQQTALISESAPSEGNTPGKKTSNHPPASNYPKSDAYEKNDGSGSKPQNNIEEHTEPLTESDNVTQKLADLNDRENLERTAHESKSAPITDSVHHYEKSENEEKRGQPLHNKVPQYMTDGPLMSSKDTAAVCLENSNEKNWRKLLWALLAADDFAGSYWLLVGLSEKGFTPFISPLLIRALQASRLLSLKDRELEDNLRSIADQYLPEDNNDVEIMIGLAAAMHPSLLFRSGNLMFWLKTPPSLSAINIIVQTVNNFASSDIDIQPEDLLGVVHSERRETSIQDAARAVKNWLEDAPHQRPRFFRANQVWQKFVRQDGALGDLLAPAANDDRKEAKKLLEKLDAWQEPGKIMDQIVQIERDLGRVRSTPIVGGPRDWILRRTREAVLLAERWAEKGSHAERLKARGGWISNKINELRGVFQDSLPELITSLKELASEAQPAPLAAASICLWRSILNLCQLLHLDGTWDQPPQPEIEKLPLADTGLGRLEKALYNRLFLVPDARLNRDGSPVEEGMVDLPDNLANAIVREMGVIEAYQAWINKDMYHFARFLRPLISEMGREDLINLSNGRLESTREELRGEKRCVQIEVDKAFYDGLISVEEQSVHIARLENIVPDEVLNFPKHRSTLREISKKILIARKKRLSELKDRWNYLQPLLMKSRIEPISRKHFYHKIDEWLERQDARIVDESLFQVERVLNEGIPFEVITDRYRDNVRSTIREFQSNVEAINNALHMDGFNKLMFAVKKGREFAGVKYSKLPEPRRNEVSQVLNSWLSLKRGNASQTDTHHHIIEIFKFLGFDIEDDHSGAVEYENRGADWWYGRISMNAGGLARPIPDFGSLSNGKYDVICVWTRPSNDTIAARIQNLRLKQRCVFVIYLGRRNRIQRLEAMINNQGKRLSMAVLDEDMLVFLTREKDARLPVFLRCSLPYSTINPYMPFRAGDVPPEIFFGRENMASDLMDANGSCFVYGGRQLGKSALVRHVERTFHNPDNAWYARVEDIKILGGPAAEFPKETLWYRIRDMLIDYKLIPKNISTRKKSEIIRHVLRIMNDRPECRILVLLDEADNFLEADAKDNFQDVELLRDLMRQTQRRFKVVFTGLHNVQRFQGIPNQPLAHFGRPICVGPLEPGAAWSLVDDPMKVMGYQIEEDTILRILSYTNYHPGLIQLFCHELLGLLNSRPKREAFPLLVRQDDVESVYKRLAGNIKERFEWTLSLDERYRAIACTLVVEQIDDRDGYGRWYSATNIMNLVSDYWEAGFSDTDMETMAGLLDEMVGLGVLLKTAENGYRLRSPNLVRIMGTEEDIFTSLASLSEKPAKVTFEADKYHILLEKNKNHAKLVYSPFTHSQERRLNPNTWGVSLISASLALNLNLIQDAVERFVPRDISEDMAHMEELPDAIVNENELEEILREKIEHYNDRQIQIYTMSPHGFSPEELARLILKGSEVCWRRQKAKDRWMRLFFVLDPIETAAWLRLDPVRREEIENKLDSVVSPYRWNEDSLEQAFAQADIMCSEVMGKHLMKLTGGWPIWLNALCNEAVTGKDIRSLSVELEKDMVEAMADQNRRNQFIVQLGLEALPEAKKVFSLVLDFGGETLPIDMMEAYAREWNIDSDTLDSALKYLRRLRLLDLKPDGLVAEPVTARYLLS